MSTRKSVVSGSFYPDKKDELLLYFEKFNQTKDDEKIDENIKAILVPHAGYIYSGFTANKAFKLASKNSYKRVIVVGPSHRALFDGASVSLYDNYETPFGNLNIDLKYCKELLEKFDFLKFDEESVFEHSTEVQAPFVKYYFGNIEFVEIIYSNISSRDLEIIFDYILKDSSNLLVISSDLSHFYSQNDAMKLDINCLNAIQNKDIALLQKCEACGELGIEAMILNSIKNNLQTKLLHYCTSADISGDKSRVVGYASAIFF